MIGERLRTIRESKNLSQGDIEKRTGLIRCYTSRVENGHTVPSIETLAKYAQALGIPQYVYSTAMSHLELGCDKRFLNIDLSRGS